MATLPDDYWVHDEASQSLIGKRTRMSFQLAQPIDVRLADAKPVTGGLIFNVLTGLRGPAAAGPKRFIPSKRGKRGDQKPENPKSKRRR
jgi:ribonuclease R